MRSSVCLGGFPAAASSVRVSRSAARIIGIIAIVLLAGSTSFGQFIVQPMKVQVGAYPGRRTTERLAIENLDENTVRTVDLRLVDVTQDRDGIWQEIEPDAQVVQDPNGARWVTFTDPDGQDFRLDVSKLRSCLSWLRLGQDVVTLDPLRRKFVDLHVTIPGGQRGYFCAALIAQTEIPAGDTGIRASVLLQFVVPIIINVQGRPMPHEIKLTDVGLQFRPQKDLTPAASEVMLKIENPGATYSRLLGYARIFGESGGHYRRITDVEFPDTGIIPGVTLNIREEVPKPLRSGKYKVQGYLIVDGRRSGAREKEIDFAGDPRIITTLGDASLELEPAEQVVEAMPGAMRSKTMKVVNASDETVIVSVEAVVPEGMAGKVMVDEQGRSIRAEQLSCADWITITPREFTLRGRQRRNLRIAARMPDQAAARPNHYAAIQLDARFPDGTSGGSTKGFVYVQTKGLEGTPRISGDDRLLSLSELAAGRYYVTATFSNLGDTHILPRCRGILSTYEQGSTAGGMARKRFVMDSERHGRTGIAKTGNMLPLEYRSFTGVLDVGDVSPGVYVLTAILEHDKGGLSVQAQKGLRVVNEGGQTSVE
ncbi:MAG: hypothetical protein ACYTAS_19625, partial [Planctomycetota bacterium]